MVSQPSRGSWDPCSGHSSLHSIPQTFSKLFSNTVLVTTVLQMTTNSTHHAFHPSQWLLQPKWYVASSLSVSEWLATGSCSTHQSPSLWSTCPRRIQLIDRSLFALPDGPVSISTMVWNLEAYFDECMSMEEQVNRLVRSCFYQLRRIRFIPWSLSIAVATSLMNSFIIARVDYCNSILAGLTKHQTGWIQSIINVTACVIYDQARFDHITPTLRDRFQWLRVPQRIDFKPRLLVYKVIHRLVQAYITNYCIEVSSRRCLHSSAHWRLHIPLPPGWWCSVHSQSAGRAYGTIFQIPLWRQMPWSCSSRDKKHIFGQCYFIPIQSWLCKCPWLWSRLCFWYSKYYLVNNNNNLQSMYYFFWLLVMAFITTVAQWLLKVLLW